MHQLLSGGSLTMHGIIEKYLEFLDASIPNRHVVVCQHLHEIRVQNEHERCAVNVSTRRSCDVATVYTLETKKYMRNE